MGAQRRIGLALQHDHPGLTCLCAGLQGGDQAQHLECRRRRLGDGEDDDIGHPLSGEELHDLARGGDLQGRAQDRAQARGLALQVGAVLSHQQAGGAAVKGCGGFRQPQRAAGILAHLPFGCGVMRPDQAAHPAQQQRLVHRLGQHVMHTRLQRAHPRLGPGLVADGDDRDMPGVRLPPEPGAESRRIAIGQGHRRDHEIRQFLPRQRERFGQAGGLDDVVIGRPQLDLQDDAIGRDRVNDEDLALHPSPCPWLRIITFHVPVFGPIG